MGETPQPQQSRPPAGGSPEPIGHGGPPRHGGPVEGARPGGAAPPPGIDSVTGALNISAFAQAFHRTLSCESLDQAALWYIDIRNFRSINLRFGFSAGSAVLRDLVSTVRQQLSHDLPIARLGADRIIFLTRGLELSAAGHAFERLVQSLNEQISAYGIDQRIELSGGIYYLREEDIRQHAFNRSLDYASIAHRTARHDRVGKLTPFTEEDLERDVRRISIEQAIDQALTDGQIQVWYQPQVNYVSGELIGAEALARWHHPELGWISPAEFIPVLENCGKIHALDLFVWEEACRRADQWRAALQGEPVPISVNVSRAEIFMPNLMEHFLELLDTYNLPPRCLRIEVTESTLVEETERLHTLIKAMRQNKLLVEMDDFGSGLSSLNMLKEVPVDVVKLDMGFIHSATGGGRGGVVLESVIRMLQGLETPIIAEGVETVEQAEMLKSMGCRLMQGYHFSRPMPAEDFERYVADNAITEIPVTKSRETVRVSKLTSVNDTSAYLFERAMGPTIYFFTQGTSSESILVNDEFYEACGLTRDQFGHSRVNPIAEIDPETRAELWKAAAEAQAEGAAFCRARVRLTQREFEGVIRYLGPNPRGEVFSLNIVKSHPTNSHTD